MAELARCGCRNTFMDETYGDRIRVVNPMGRATPKGGSAREYRCTACGATVDASKVLIPERRRL